MKYLEYAYLQTGRDADALRVVEAVKDVPGINSADIASDGSRLTQTGGTIHDAMWVIVGAGFGNGASGSSYELQGGSLSVDHRIAEYHNAIAYCPGGRS